MRYVVTGANGFVGTALTQLLLSEGHEVVAAVRNPGKAEALAFAGAELAKADLADEGALAQAFEGADGVFHVAGWYRIGDRHPEEAWRVNVDGTRNALAAAAQTGVPRVVHTSTVAVNSDTRGALRDETYRYSGKYLSVYEASKAAAHRVAEQFAAQQQAGEGKLSTEVVIVMPGGIYGPNDTSTLGRLMLDAAHGKPTLAPKSLKLMEAHVDDVAAGHLRAMQLGRAGESYLLVGEQTDAHQMVAEVAALSGGRAPYDVPGPLLRAFAAMGSVTGRLLPLPAQVSAEAMRSAQASYLATPAKAIDELGWSFRPLSVGLPELVRSYDLGLED